MINLEISKLIEIQDLNKAKIFIINIIEILLRSINDWPNSILILEDFELEVRNIIGGEVTQKRLEIFMPKIDLSKNAWQAESLSQLIEVFNFYENEVTLKEIIGVLKQKLEDEKLV